MARGHPPRAHGRARLLWGCAGASNARWLSGGPSRCFFHPVHRHLEWSAVLGARRLACLLGSLPLVTASRDKGGPLLAAVRPRGHRGRLHPVHTGSCLDRVEPFERFERHTGCALRTLLFPLCRHRPSPPLHSYGHSSLSSLPVQFSGYIIKAVSFRVKAPVTRRPPHRSGREGFPHPVPR